MSLSSPQDMLVTVINGCRWAEHAWVTNVDQKRIAYAQRMFWTAPNAPLQDLFALLPKESEMAFTTEQTAKATALGIDLTKIDWTKVADIIKFILDILAGTTPKVTKAVGVGCCDHMACCKATLESALKTAQLSLAHYDACCKECGE